MKILACLVCACSLVAVDNDPRTIWQLSVNAGTSLGVTAGRIPVNNSALGGNTTHELDGNWHPGGSAGLALNRLRCDAEGDGWYSEVGLQLNVWNGQYNRESIAGVSVETAGDMRLEGPLLTYSIGWTRRWDSEDIRLMPRQWQFDLGPQLGAGVMHARITGSSVSDIGPAWMAGLRSRVTAALSRHWRLGGDLGVAYGEAHVRWSNTDTSHFYAFGPTAALVLMCEF